MPNYNEAQGVADLLSQFDFNIINEGPGDFSTQHRIEAHGSDEPVSLKAAVRESREASAALAGNDAHENIGQDAR